MSDDASSAANPDFLNDLVKAALSAGADAAEAVSTSRATLSVSVRKGALEEVEREESRDLGLRVFIGRRQASVSSSDLSEPTRTRLIERAVAMARLAPEDPHASLAPQDRLARTPHADLDLFDPTTLSPAQLEERAREVEAIALSQPGVTRSEGGSASHATGHWTLVTSHGFSGQHRGSAFSLSASVIAERDGQMERDGEGRTLRHLADLPSAEAIGRVAGERAVRRLGARKVASTTAPVIIDRRSSAALLSPLIQAMAGPSVARGVSFLKDRMGQQILPEDITLIDDPLRPRALGSTPFDDEGVTVQSLRLIDQGRVASWLLNTASAAQLGLESTGHASRALAGPPGVSGHNIHLEPGAHSREQMMKDAGTGLLVTEMFSPALNPNTGDWSAGVTGFWFENGEIAHPVSEVTVAGQLLSLYGRMIAGSDLEFRGSTNAPSLMFDKVAIAGL